MNTSQDIPWKRLSVEAAAIVASILLAFAIDAWWEEQQDRQTERVDLERLHAEFVSNRDRVNDNAMATRAEAASAEMYELLVAHLGQDEPLEIQVSQIGLVQATPTFDAVTPVLDGLILSGRLDNIRNQKVVLAISRWQRMIQQVEETEIGARQFVETQLVPALVKRGNMGSAFSKFDPFFKFDADGVTAVMVDEELLGLVAHRFYHTKFITNLLDYLKIAASDVVVAVEQAQNGM